MAYVTGTANSITDLLSAIQAACTGNGWTLSGNVLHKETCYVEAKVDGASIAVQGGTGIDGANNLTGRSDRSAGMFPADDSTPVYYLPPGPGISWPMTYHIHVLSAPDEVFVIGNYALSWYQTMAFGQSTMPGLAGSGNWYCADSFDHWIDFDSKGLGGVIRNCGVSLFAKRTSTPNGCGVDHQFDDQHWSIAGSYFDWGSLFFRQPNAWNQESVLIPIRVYASRPNGYISPVLECAHARFLSVANMEDGQIITSGPDRWKVYPWWSRQVTSAGHAIRYDGP